MKTRKDRIDQMLDNRLESVTLVAEATYLRHNLSAILRSAEAFGVHDVHLVSERKNKIGGAAKGSEKWVNLVLWNDIGECLTTLKERGYSIWTADIHPKAYTPDTLPIETPVAIVMGTELSGVSKQAKQLADGCITIPMQGVTQSLNVSVASACILFRLSTRFRDKKGGGDLSEERKKEFRQRLQKREQVQKDSRQRRKALAKQFGKPS